MDYVILIYLHYGQKLNMDYLYFKILSKILNINIKMINKY